MHRALPDPRRTTWWTDAALTSSAHQSAPEGQRNTDADPRSELPREVIANHAIMSGISPPAPQP